MKKIHFVKDVVPHLAALLVFLIVSISYFSPVFFESKEISQYDIQQWEGGARELLDHRAATDEEGLWTNSMFGGMPAYLINIEWSDKGVEMLHRIYTLGLPHPVRVVFAALLSFYILLLSFKIRPYLAMAGAIAFGLSTYLIIGIAAGHNARIGAIAYMPLVLAGIHITMTGKRWLGVGLTAAALALHLRFNHLQMTYYLLLIVIAYGVVILYVSYRNRSLQAFATNIGLLVAAALIALASFFGEFWATYEYSKYTIRGPSEISLGADKDAKTNDSAGLDKAYAFQYSSGIWEPITLFIPNFMGGASSNYLVNDPNSATYFALTRAGDQQVANQLAQFSRSYWGDQPNAAPYYAGAVTFFLFIIGLIFAERKYKIWLIAVFAIGILLSWGSNFSTFNYLMFDYFPGYNKFRSVTFTLILPILSMGLLGMLGLERLLSEGLTAANRRKLGIGILLSAGLCLFFIVAAGLMDTAGTYDEQFPVWFANALQEDRAGLLREDAFRSLVFMLVGFSGIWFYLNGNISELVLSGVLVAAITIDLWSADRRFLNGENFDRSPRKTFFGETEADQLIKTDTRVNYRVYNLRNPFAEARTSYHHKSVGGYHGAKLRRYQDLYDYVLEPETQEMISALRSGTNDLSGMGVVNMLNVRYLLIADSRQGVIPNDYALGNAWLVGEVELVNNPDEEISRLGTIDTKSTAIIDRSQFDVGPEDFSDISADGSVTLTHYAPGQLAYDYNSPSPSLVVFSEIYYPQGWEARIDNNEADIIRANYVLRAMKVPAGQHTITFSFRPKPYVIGNKVTFAGNVMVVLLFLGSLGYSLRKDE